MSNNTSNNSQAGGVGFFGLLAIVFITLKLTGYVAWSWWWVLSPIWIPFVLAIIVGLILVAAYAGSKGK